MKLRRTFSRHSDGGLLRLLYQDSFLHCGDSRRRRGTGAGDKMDSVDSIRRECGQGRLVNGLAVRKLGPLAEWWRRDIVLHADLSQADIGQAERLGKA